MKHLYGTFSDSQIQSYATTMHNEIHKLLLHKDNNITEVLTKLKDKKINL